MQELLLLFLEGRKDAEERIFFFFWLKSISLIINPRPRMAFANVKRWLGNTFTSPSLSEQFNFVFVSLLVFNNEKYKNKIASPERQSFI